jgi:cation transporter-like permease
VVGDGLRAMIVGDGLTIENDGIATSNLTVTQTLNGRAVSDILPTYKKYIALISQTGTAAPTVVELENTIGPIIWTRAATGVYYGTLTDMFPDPDKVYIMINQVVLNSIALASCSSNDIVAIDTTNLHSPTAAHHDTHLSKNTLEIRVYE